MIRFLICSALLWPFASAFSQQPVQTLPFRLVDNLIIISLEINESDKPLNFMFDTGAGVTVVDKKTSEKLGLEISGQTRLSTGGRSLTSESSAYNRIGFGGEFSLDSVTLEILDISHISEYLGFQLDGIIGYDLLAAALIETNIDSRELRIYTEHPREKSVLMDSIQIVMLESGNFGIPAMIVRNKNETPVNLILKIDTGAGNSITVHNPAVQKFQLLNPDKKYKKSDGFSVDSTRTTNPRSKFSRVKIDKTTWKNVPVVLETDKTNFNSRRLGDGLIGQKLLLDFNIIYHLKENIMYLEKRK